MTAVLNDRPLSTRQPARRKPSVLLADVEALVTAALDKALRRAGYSVYLALSASGAVELYERLSDQIDLVILDESVLADLDGSQTLTKLRAINPAVRCCFLTGADHGPLSSQQPNSILRKPFALIEVVQLAGGVTNP